MTTSATNKIDIAVNHTVAKSPFPLALVGVHAESLMASDQKNAEFCHDTPALVEIAAAAWVQVKDDDDPMLADCVPTHIEKLQSHANAILAGSAPQSGDTLLARFEQAVYRLTKEKD